MRHILSLAFILIGLELQAQPVKVTLGTYCGGDYKSPTREIEKGLRAINMGDYPNAQVYIGAALRQNENDQHALYLRGELSIRIGRIQIAEASWKQLVQRCPGYKPELLFMIGTLAIEGGSLEEAKRYLKQWLAREDREYAYDKEAEAMLAEINIKQSFFNSPVPYDPKPARNVNTHWDEYLAALTPDGSAFYFTRRSQKRNKYDGPAGTLRQVEEFSMARALSASGGFPKLEEGKALEYPFNAQYNEGGPSMTADNTFMAFTICERDELTGEQFCDLYYTTFTYGVWNGIRKFPEGINTDKHWESQPSISPNGDVLYFTSDRPGGFGGLDIYRAYRSPDGEWSAPENLGPTVNTRKNEKSPFIHADSESLYFASDGHPGMGGYDLFKIKVVSGSAGWEKPQNLGYPINTEKDEIGLMVTMDGQQAYFATNKINSANGWDIYYFDLYEAVQPEEVVLVKGQLKTADFVTDDEPKVVLKNSKTSQETNLNINEENGSFSAVVMKKELNDIIITLEAKKASFSAAPVRLMPKLENQINVVELELRHDELAAGESYPIPHILFQTASDRFDTQSELLIAEFSEFLAATPSLRVEIQGHTDNIGDAGANLALSQRRARRVAETIKSYGIDAVRISSRGYGESKPVASNETEVGRAQNRRTVFVVKSL